MKRKLSLLLAVVMILGSFSFAFAADEVVPAEFLEKEGILVGNDSGDLMLDQPLLRKDAVVLLARLMKAEEEAEAFEKEGLPTFNDLADNPYYKGFLAWAEDNGYFTGKTDGSFGYTDNLEAVEYALVLLRALGYVNDNKADEWDKAWTEAEKLGLLEDVKAERRDEIKREEVAQMTYNALGVTMKDSDKTLAEFLGITMPEAGELEVVEVYTENLAEVVVELSNAKLVKNKEALTNPANYRFDDSSIKVYNAELKGNDVVLTLVPYGRLDEIKEDPTPLTKGKEYDLIIRNIDPAINKTYKDVEAVDNAIPAVESVEFMGTHGIKVTTTEPIDNPLERNFRISDKRTSMVVEQYGREIILTPYHGKAFDEDATELVVEELVDFARYKSAKTVETMELDKDTTAPKVVEAYRSGDKLTLVFDQDVYHESIKSNESRRELGNVSFVERRVTFYAETAKKVDTNVVVYTFEREIPRDTEVVVEGVQNHSKETMEKDVVTPVLFVDEHAPVVISDLTTSIRTTGDEKRGDKLENPTKGLTIKFDKDIKEFEKGTDEFIKNYKVEDYFDLYILDVARRNEITDDVKIEVVEVKDDSIKLDFVNKDGKDELRVNNKYRDYDYVLEVRDFRDLSGNRMVREYIDFQILPAAVDFNAVIDNIETVREFNRINVEITLKFNGYVDKASAEDASNYYIDGKLLVDEAIVERDGTTVTLVIHDMTAKELVDDYEKLEISPRVKNLAKTATVEDRFLDLLSNDERAAKKVEDLIKALPKVEDINAENLEEVEEKVTEVEKAYDALTNKQKELVSDSAKANLKAVKDAIDEIKGKLDDEEATEIRKELAEKIEGEELVLSAKVEQEKDKLESGITHKDAEQALTDAYAKALGDYIRIEEVAKAGKTVEADYSKATAKVGDYDLVVLGQLVDDKITFKVVLARDFDEKKGFDQENLIIEQSVGGIDIETKEDIIAEAKELITKFSTGEAKYDNEVVGKSVHIQFAVGNGIFETSEDDSEQGANQENKFKVTAYFIVPEISEEIVRTNTFIKRVTTPENGERSDLTNGITTTFYDDMKEKDFYSWHLEGTEGLTLSELEVEKVVVEFEYKGHIVEVELPKQ